MALPAPYMDALNRPAWDGTPSDVSKAYRKLSALVHPDKNPQADARLAFEALNKAHRALRDPGTLVRCCHALLRFLFTFQRAKCSLCVAEIQLLNAL